LLKNIDEHEFKSEIQKRDKQKDKLQDIRDILEMFTNSVGDFLRQWVIDSNVNVIDNVYKLIVYSNNVIYDIRKRYNSSVPNFIEVPQTQVHVEV
jgi:hypothetical protein